MNAAILHELTSHLASVGDISTVVDPDLAEADPEDIPPTQCASIKSVAYTSDKFRFEVFIDGEILYFIDGMEFDNEQWIEDIEELAAELAA